MTDEYHTPGPWVYEPDNGVPEYDPIVVWGTDGPGMGRIAEASLDNCNHPEAAANARLMAAAPDLLAALTGIEWSATEYEWGETCFSCPWCGEPKENGHLSDCRLEAAIAKATGATQ